MMAPHWTTMDIRSADAEPSRSTGRADPRLLQANERTLLAWMRTGIALMTFGFVIARIGVWLRALAMAQRGPELHPFGTAWIGAAFVALGAFANAVATMRYRPRNLELASLPMRSRYVKNVSEVDRDWFMSLDVPFG